MMSCFPFNAEDKIDFTSDNMIEDMLLNNPSDPTPSCSSDNMDCDLFDCSDIFESDLDISMDILKLTDLDIKPDAFDDILSLSASEESSTDLYADENPEFDKELKHEFFEVEEKSNPIKRDIMWSSNNNVISLEELSKCVDPNLCIPPLYNETSHLWPSYNQTEYNAYKCEDSTRPKVYTPSLATTEEQDASDLDSEDEDVKPDINPIIQEMFDDEVKEPSQEYNFITEHSYSTYNSVLKYKPTKTDYLGMPTPSPSDAGSLSGEDEDVDVVTTSGNTVVLQFNPNMEIANTRFIQTMSIGGKKQFGHVVSRNPQFFAKPLIVAHPAPRGRPSKKKPFVIPTLLTPRQMRLQMQKNVNEKVTVATKVTYNSRNGRLTVMAPQNRRKNNYIKYTPAPGRRPNKRKCDETFETTVKTTKTRDAHNSMERDRRINLGELLQGLKGKVPSVANNDRASKLCIVDSAVSYIESVKQLDLDLEAEKAQLLELVEMNKRKLEKLHYQYNLPCNSRRQYVPNSFQPY